MNRELVKVVSGAKIKRAMKAIKSDSAPGPMDSPENSFKVFGPLLVHM